MTISLCKFITLNLLFALGSNGPVVLSQFKNTLIISSSSGNTTILGAVAKAFKLLIVQGFLLDFCLFCKFHIGI